MFESAHKCCKSGLWFRLLDFQHYCQLIETRADQLLSVFSASTLASDEATKILSPFCCDVNAGSTRDFSCLLLSLWLYDQHNFDAFDIYPNLGTHDTMLSHLRRRSSSSFAPPISSAKATRFFVMSS